MKSLKKTIMVIDDMPTILEHARQILRENYNILPCTSCVQAQDILEKRLPDMILLDINMPDMDGYEMIKKLKSEESTKSIPVIMMTTELTNEIEVKGFSLGADDFITKPFSSISIIKRIETQFRIEKTCDSQG